MQVSVETTQGLERRMTVTVPAERIEREVESRLKNLSRTVRLSGFRPGKVPVKVVASRFGNQVRNEVINEVTQRTFQEAVSQENLRLASMPKIEPKLTDPGTDLQYVAIFEVVSDVEIAEMADIEVDKPVAGVTEDDIDHMIETLRKQRATWTDVERAAQTGDRVTIDFHGQINGSDFEGNQGSNVPLVLGSNSFISGFEDKLAGARAGDEVKVDLQFPDDYRVKDLAGKPVVFNVNVHAVAESALPEVDEEFMRTFEVSDGQLETFRKEIRETMQAELDQALREKLKQNVFDVLYRQAQLELPSALVNSTVDEMLAQAKATFTAQGGNADELNLNRGLFEESARRKVALGMIVGDIARKNNITVDYERVRNTVETLASSYDQPEEVVRWYYADRSRMENVESLVLEDMVVDWVVGQARVTEKETNFEELMHDRRV